MATTEARARKGPYPMPYPAPDDAVMDDKMFIGGEWVESVSGERFDVWSPGDGSLIGSVPKGVEADVHKAIEAATKAQKEMAKLSIPARAKLLFKASEIAYRRLRARRARAVPRVRQDHHRGARRDRALLGSALHRGGRGHQAVSRRAINPSIQEDTLNKRILVIRQPMGVIGIISPVELAPRHPQHRRHPRAGGRQRRDPQAGEHHPVQRPHAGRGLRGGRLPGGRGQRRHRTGRGRRRGAGQQPGHPRHPLHRRDGDRRAPDPDRRHQAAHARARRQRPARRHGRRQHRGGRGGHHHRLLLPGRPGVHRLGAHPRPRGGPRRVRGEAGHARQAGQGRQPSRRGHRHGPAEQPGQPPPRCSLTSTMPASAAARSSWAATSRACTRT